MPPLDLSGFVTPEQKFEGLYKLGETIQKKQAEEAKAKSPFKPLTFTPTGLNVLDDITSTKVSKINQKGNTLALAYPGATTSQLQLALAPDIEDLSKTYSLTKNLSNQFQNDIKSAPDYYDKVALQENFTKIFYNPDGTPKTELEISDYASKNPSIVKSIIGNNPGIAKNLTDDWIKESEKKKIGYKVEGGSTGGGGGVTTENTYDIEHPWWIEPERDNKGAVVVSNGVIKFKPKSVFATDQDEKILTDKGEQVPLVPEEVYKNYLAYPKADNVSVLKAKVTQALQNYKDATGEAINPSDPNFNKKIESLGRAILYQDLASRDLGSYDTSKSNLTHTVAPRTGRGSGSGSGTGILTGNPMDELGMSTPVNGAYTKDSKKRYITIKNGIATHNDDNTPYTGTYELKLTELPSIWRSILESNNIDIVKDALVLGTDPDTQEDIKGMKVVFDSDGQIKKVEYKNGIVNRDDFNRFGKKWNKVTKGNLEEGVEPSGKIWE